MDHIVSVFLPPPIGIGISVNTFIRFEISPGSGENVGVVEGIQSEASKLIVRRFLSLDDLRRYVPAGNTVMDEVTLWPKNASCPPFYLCDSDLRSDVLFNSVCGYAFVFFMSDDISEQLHGMANTYLVSSYFDSSSLIVRHGRTFNSFPSERFRQIFPTCHASDLWFKVLSLKRKIQEKLNTRGMSTRNTQVIFLDNFDINAWDYVVKVCRAEVLTSSVVVRNVYMKEDECIVEKSRQVQYSFVLTLPIHLPYAKLLLGSSAGLGVRSLLNCKIGKQQRAVREYRVDESDRVNFVPFEDVFPELSRRGFEFKYVPNRMVLTVTIRYRLLKTPGEVRAAFGTRLPTEDDAVVDESWPLYYSTKVFNSTVCSINLSNHTVLLNNGQYVSINDCINYLEQSYT